MTNHVPDLERCKRLEKAGFQGITHFVWVRNEMKEWRVITVWENTWTELLDSPFYQVIRAPIVTELLAEIRRMVGMILPKNDVTSIIDMALNKDGTFYAAVPAYSQTYYDEPHSNADTLPNALADLWCWLAERET